MVNKATGIQLRRKSDGAVRPPCVHAEAYCLMKYRGQQSGRVEWLWNSRDGVTPFGVYEPGSLEPSADLDNLMNHEDWFEDSFVPNFVPPVGMRVFMSWGDCLEPQKEEARAAWARRIESAPADIRPQLEASEPFGMDAASPMVITVDEELHNHFRRLAEEDPFVAPQPIRRMNPPVIPGGQSQ